MRSSFGLAVSLLHFVLACGSDDSSSKGASGGAGTSSAGTGGRSGSGAGGSAGSGGGGSGAFGGSESGGASHGGSSTGGSSTGGSVSNLYVAPSAIIGGACEGLPAPATPPCSYAPEQVYCEIDAPTRVIMAVCSSSGRSQCEVMSECEPGWHACTATDYVARGGRDVPPAFSSNTDRAWLAACVRDVTGVQFKNEPCSVCGQEPSYPPSVQWWCDGAVVYEGGMAGDTLGVLAGPECMRVGSNAADHGAFWSISFTDGAPSFVMCCLDEL